MTDELSPEAEAFARAHAERGEQIEAGWRRADAYARSWAQWRVQRLANQAPAPRQGPQEAPQPLRPAGEAIAPPAPESAAPRGFVSGSRREYQRESGDPGAAEGYQPSWAVPLGRKP